MVRFICETCGAGFDAPLKKPSYEKLDGRFLRDVELLCPICCNPYFDEAEQCPKCGEAKKADENPLCPSCRASLKRRFTAFADSLTAEEEAQLDDWLDGDTVENRRNWT